MKSNKRRGRIIVGLAALDGKGLKMRVVEEKIFYAWEDKERTRVSHITAWWQKVLGSLSLCLVFFLEKGGEAGKEGKIALGCNALAMFARFRGNGWVFSL